MAYSLLPTSKFPDPGSGPTISVILPTRDRSGRLRAAIASVTSQRLLPFEVLVVDDSADGSADGSAERAIQPLREGTSVPLSVLRGEGRGPGAARNLGLQAAAGELLAFLDDDDVWHPDKLARQVAWFVDRPELGLLGTAAWRVGEGLLAPALSVGTRGRLRRISRAALVHANCLVTSSVIARRCCFEDCGGFDPSLPLAQDWEMWLRISRRWEVAVLTAPLVTYHLHPAQRSARSRRMRECECRVARQTMEEESGWLHGAARRRLSWARCRLGRAHLREGSQIRAGRAAREAIALNPLNVVAWGTLLSSACRLAGRGPSSGVGRERLE